MKNFKIYQANINAKYCFFGLDIARNEIDANDYLLVYEGEIEEDKNIHETLEAIFRMSNLGELKSDNKMRSVSVSDIIEIDNKRYYVDTFGFEEINIDFSSNSKYLDIFKNKVTKNIIDSIFYDLENIGYKTILSNKAVGPKNEVKIWIAVKDDKVIVYNNCSFTKKDSLSELAYFTEEEYEIIKNG